MKKLLSCFFLCLLSLLGFPQSGKFISCGNGVSALLSDDGKVYTCGNNSITFSTSSSVVTKSNVLGVGSDEDYVSDFTEVSYFSENNITIKQVCAKGQSFAAIDCNNSVWTWGDNSKGQLGLGTSQTVESIPQQVLAGCVANTIWDDGSGHLTNVKTVCMQGNNGYAVLSDGRVVSWGDELYLYSTGLGNNTEDASYEPVFVLNENGNPMGHVVDVCAGDYAVYLLVDEDGDGKGVVYSFGYADYRLGRDETNGKNLYADSVMVSDTKPLDNIVKISTSAVSGMALDSDGYVWTWGNNGWGGICGWGEGFTNNNLIKRVVKGETSTEENDGTYLLAKDIAGGCGYCSAITINGNVVSWGNNDSDYNSGNLGNGGTISFADSPVYTRISEDEILANCVSVSCGNGHAFAVDGNNEIYVWGANDYGQLGLSNTTTQNYATPFLFSANTFPQSPVSVLISPKELIVNPSKFTSQEIQATVSVGSSFRSLYDVKWYKDNNLITSGKLNESNITTYTATELGTYKIKVEYTGEVLGCSDKYENLKSGIAEATIAPESQEFEIGELTSDCKDSVNLAVIPKKETSQATYTWWLDEDKTASAGSTIGDARLPLNVENLKNEEGETTFYVEELYSDGGTFLPKGEYSGLQNSSGDYVGTAGGDASCSTGFVLTQDVVLTSVDIPIIIDPSYFSFTNDSIVREYDLVVTIYGSKMNNNYNILDDSEQYGTLTVHVQRSYVGYAKKDTLVVTATGSVALAKGKYFALPSIESYSGGSIYFIKSSNDNTVTDNDIFSYLGISAYGNWQQNNSGCLFNFKYLLPQRFTSLVPVTITSDCDCTIPKPVSISQDIENNVLCSGDITLTPSAQNAAADFTYEWFLNGESVSTPSTTNTFAATQTGTYTVKVRDSKNDECEKAARTEISYKESSVKVGFNATNPICETANGEISVTVTGGDEPYTYLWDDNATEQERTKLTEGVYSVVVTDRYGCTGNGSMGMDKNYGNLPKVSIDYINPICETANGEMSVNVTGGVEPYTYLWNDEATESERTKMFIGDYKVTVTDKYGCTGQSSVSLIKNESNMPEITAQVQQAICGHDVGEITLDVTNGTAPYTYLWNDGNTETKRTTLSPNTYSVSVVDSYGCETQWSTDIVYESFKYQPEIAMVSVSQEVKAANLVVWQKEKSEAIDYYTIYRETSKTDVYQNIATVPYSDISVFVDENTNNMQQSYKYKITATDLCGDESPMSPYHKTIHLQKGVALESAVNLSWEGYEGFEFDSYSIYRVSSLGTEEIAQVTSTTKTYTDLEPAAGTLSYYVAVELPKIIDVNDSFMKTESGPFVIAISNIAEVENSNAINDVENSAVIYVRDDAIVVENANGNPVAIYTAVGQSVARTKGDCVIAVSQKGVYIVVVGTKTNMVVVK